MGNSTMDIGITQYEIEERLNQNRFNRAGTSCYFVLIDKDRALKLYDYKDERDFALEHQLTAFSANIGPEVFEQDLFYTVYDHERGIELYLFGYVTEIVETIDYKRFKSLYGQVRKTMEKWERVFGFGYFDDHEGNFGIKNGNLVFIDFGEESVY